MVVRHFLDNDVVSSDRDDQSHLPSESNRELTGSIGTQQVQVP
jgi:hypothetical protein